MNTNIEMQVREISGSDTLSDEGKIRKLLALQSDSRAAQRAETETGMEGKNSLPSDLQAIDRALAVLGYEDDAGESSES